MRIGPIETSVLSWGQSPHKTMQARAPGGRNRLLFDTTRPHAVAAEAYVITIDVPLLERSPQYTRALLTQLIELSINPKWQQCGIYCTFREDGVTDPSDGWYLLENNEIPELTHNLEWADANMQLIRRYSRLPSLGIWYDSKLMPDEIIHGGGTTLVAYPAGMDLANCYPPPTYTLAGQNGNIGLLENPNFVPRAPFLSPTDMMTKARCAVTDETVDSSVGWEVFWRDHVNQNGYTRIDNDLIRYTLHVGDTAPLLETWSSGAWITVGNYQLQAYNGATDLALPLQGYELITISPEEVVWEERRYDAAGSGLVVVKNRIRRGSRVVESFIVTAAGLGLTHNAVGITNIPPNAAWTIANSADTSGVVATRGGSVHVPGFAFLTKPAVAAAFVGGNQNFFSGLRVPAGSLARIGIVVGLQDAIYAAAGTPAAYAAKVAAYNRQRILQRTQVGT